MAMEDPRVLLHMNMNFNPFRSSSHSTPNSSSPPPRPVVEAPQQRILNDPDNDSWHTNAPNRSIIHNNNDNSPASSSHHHHHGSHNKPPASALSWFSSWTTPTTPTTTTTLRTATASSSSAIIIQDGQHTNSNSVSAPQQHHLPPLSPPPLSPAKSMTMKRGMSSESHEVHESNGSSHIHKSKSPLPLGGHNKLLGVTGGGGGCVPTTIHQNGSSSNGISSPIRSTSCVVDESQMDALGLPPYPAPTKAPRTQMIHATPRTNKPLLQEFPMPGNTSAAALPPYEVPTKAPRAQVIHATPRTNKPLLQEFPMSGNVAAAARIANKKKITSKSNSQPLSKCKQPLAKEEDSTFPGFALFQFAKAYYCMGQLSQALDTTTECLAFQKISLSGNYEGNTSSASAAAAAAMAKGGGGTAVASSPKLESIRKGSIDSNDTNNSVMTPLDLRSSFVPTVLGVVQSLKGSESSNNPMNGQQQPTHHHPHHYHPMLSNSISIMIAQYPTHACVAQTLFLRGRFLAECGMTDNDYSLLQQAIQHAEMAVAIQRKLLLPSISNEELAPPLIFLGNMKTKLGHFNEADMSYKEAVSILKDARSCARRYHVDAMENNGQDAKEVASSDYAKHHFKRLTGEFANALYLHGKAYHCQRMHAQAFGCYNKALNLLRKAGGVSVSSRDNKLSVKRIVRCMKNRYALEKLVSAYWDDPGTI